MKRERFWFGVTLCFVPVVLLLLALGPFNKENRSGPVEGHVSIHGRPMTGGHIWFVPDDLNLQPAGGRVDNRGHYRIGPSWYRKGTSSEARYRICLIPKPRRAAWGEPSDLDWVGTFGVGADPGNTEPMGPTKVASRSLRRLSDPSTSDLEVRLDSRPAQIDIAL
jgi:hypothetical protein